MKSATRLIRRTRLWEAGTARVRRIALGGVIFAAVVLLKVIEPYHQVDNRPNEQEISAKKAEGEKIEGELKQLEAVEKALTDMEAAIETARWNAKINDFISYFENGGGDDVQNEARSTIEGIADEIQSQIVNPIKATIDITGVTGDIAAVPGEIEDAIGVWEVRWATDPDWYHTVQRKISTAELIRNQLRAIKTEAAEAVLDAKQSLNDEKTRLTEEKETIDLDIKGLLKDIQNSLDAVLPSWAQGLVTAPNMVALYPWILAAIAAYLVGNALDAARHFRGMADEEGWSAAERSDPLLSSAWTLTWRGVKGTGATVFCYIAVLAALSYCLSRSLNPPGPGETPTFSIQTISSVMGVPAISLMYGFMMLAVIVVVLSPLRDRVD